MNDKCDSGIRTLLSSASFGKSFPHYYWAGFHEKILVRYGIIIIVYAKHFVQIRISAVLVVLGLVLSGCSSESGKIPKLDDTYNRFDSDDTEDVPEEEICDGLDNDGDGLIDEGFDSDDDSIADCFQCQIELGIAGYNGYNDYCESLDEKDGDLNRLGEAWVYDPDFDGYEPFENGCGNPVIVDLDNDNIGDIICSEGHYNAIYSLNGIDGRVMWSIDYASDFAVAAVADYDNDGWLDVSFVDRDGYLVMVDGYSGGDVNTYRSRDRAVPLLEDWLDICDLHHYSEPYSSAYVFSVDVDMDGQWEVLTPAGLFDPVDGVMLYEFDIIEDSCDWASFMRGGFDVVFLGGFEQMNYMFLDGLYSVDGYNLFKIDVPYVSDESINNFFGMRFTGFLIVEVDGDDDPEFIIHDHEKVSVLDADGKLLSAWYVANKFQFMLSTGCAGDVNGDGISELFLPVSKYSEYMSAPASAYMGSWSIDGTLLWSRDISLYGLSSCSTFDFDNDGSDEVMFSDQDYFYIVSGVDGEILYSYERTGVSSSDWIGQIGLWSMVVDLDGDGSVELINASPLAARGGEPAVRVLRHAEGGFPPGGRIWPWHSWSGVGMHWDGRPQHDQPGAWLYPGRHRGQAQVHMDGSDLQPFVSDACVAEAEARLSVGIENLGPYGLGGTLLLEALDEGGAVVASHAFLTSLEPGYRTETVEWVFSPEAVQQGLRIRASTDVSPDCNVHNNTLRWTPDDASSVQ